MATQTIAPSGDLPVFSFVTSSQRVDEKVTVVITCPVAKRAAIVKAGFISPKWPWRRDT
jgi:hypothetical protein